MTEKRKKYLSDILRAIYLTEEFITDIKNYSDYLSDAKTQSAVERQLGIIGEALNKFRQEEDNLEIESAPKIIGFRNRLIHAYDSIDNSIVWTIIKTYLPKLKVEIEELYE